MLWECSLLNQQGGYQSRTLILQKKIGFICFNGRPWKMLKNVFISCFYLISFCSLSLTIFNFFPNFFGHVQKQFDKERQVYFQNL